MSVAKISPLPRTEMDALLLGRLDELTVSCESNARNKNLMGVLISILVLVAISSMIVVAIVVINPDIVSQSARSFQPREAITLEEAMLNELAPNSFAFQWLSSSADQSARDELLFEDSKNIQIMSLPPANETNSNSNDNSNNNTRRLTLDRQFANGFRPNITTLISNTSLLSSIDYQGFKLSPSKRYLLIWTARKKQYRHSFTAKYFIYDIKQDLISLLSTEPVSPQQAGGDGATATSQQVETGANQFEHLDSATEYLNSRWDGDKSSRFQSAEWFSSSADGDSLILIQENDLYLLANVANKDAAGTSLPVRLTFTGQQEGIFNGIPDWLYEEEILADIPAFQVSPKATSLAYMSFNDSQVDLMPFSFYGPSEQIYPEIRRIRYPKAGRANPRVTVHVVDQLASGRNRRHLELALPDELARRQHYIGRMSWLGDDRVALTWLNRNQNESYVVFCSRQLDWKCEKNLHSRANGGWLELSDSEPLILDEGHYLAIILKPEGEDVGEFRHLAKVSLDQADSYSFLTSGRREVTAINGLDREKGLLYYTSSVENEPGQRQVFALNLETMEEICLSCELLGSSLLGDECLSNSASMSQSGKYFVFSCDGPGVPRTELRSTELILRQAWLRSQRRAVAAVASSKLKSARAVEFSSNSPLSQQLSPIRAHMNGMNAAQTKANEQQESTTNQIQLKLQLQLEQDAADGGQDPSLLWTIEDNRELRDKLQSVKAMPLTMRLKVPIPSTNYSANVLLLLPPQLGGGISGSSSATPGSLKGAQTQRGGHHQRSKRSAPLLNRRRSASGGLEQPVGAYLTPESIGDYVDQLNSGQQFPMVVDVYGGPGSQKVDYRFHIGFGHYLASNRRTIYAMIDGRGSGYQGTKRLYELYHRFGTVEIQDQIEVAAWLARTYTFIDAGRVAIWGWSYGGYAAAMALAQSNAQALQNFQAELHHLRGSSNASSSSSANPATGNRAPQSSPVPSMKGVFECAASVAPVTNWIYYDTAYTERFMSSPYANSQYDESAPGDHNNNNIESTSPRLLPTPLLNGAGYQANRWISLSNVTAARQAQQQQQLSPLAGLIQDAATPTNKQAASLDMNEHYLRASLIDQIANIDRRRFLLIHGTADDNVHFQQSIFLMKRLIQKNVMFETRVYPDQDHSIANKADKLHLGSTLSNFFAECFDVAY